MSESYEPPKVTHMLDDQDTLVIIKFDDGVILGGTEKSMFIIKEGKIIERWWKEEPSGQHYQAYLDYLQSTLNWKVGQVSRGRIREQKARLESGGKLADLLFIIGHQDDQDYSNNEPAHIENFQKELEVLINNE